MVGPNDLSLKTEAWVVPEQGAKLELREITLPPLEATQVEVEMMYCGLCHTDIHMKDNDWGISDYPMVPGHEGIGKVRHLGSSCRSLKVGDVVGITWIRDSCRKCDACHVGRENVCREGYQGTYLGPHAGCWGKDAHNAHGGCFSKVMRIEEKFAFILPDGMKPEAACPLMCGGGTVFEPIEDYVKPGTKVGVIGVGGLGTVAIKFSKLYGGLPTAITRSKSKEAGARAAGAVDFCVYTDEEEKQRMAGKLDVIIDTTPANGDLAGWLDMLKFDGIYIRVGIMPGNDMELNYKWIPLIFTQKKIQGSIVVGSARTHKMLQLAHNNCAFMEGDDPTWSTQELPFSQVNQAMDMLASGKNSGWRILLKWEHVEE